MSEPTLSHPQVLAEHLVTSPGDEDARLDLARLLLGRGQIDLARRVLEDVTAAAPAPLLALRNRARAAPPHPQGVPVSRQGVSWAKSGRRTLLGLLAVFLLFVAAATIPLWVGHLALLHERRRTIALLGHPSPEVRVEAASRLTGLFDDDRPADVGALMGRALDLATLEPSDAIRALEPLRCWSQTGAIAAGLRNDSRDVRLSAAQLLAAFKYCEQPDLIAQAALGDPMVALALIPLIVENAREQDIDIVVELSQSRNADVREASVRAVTGAIERRASAEPDARLLSIALEGRSSPRIKDRDRAIEIGIAHGDARSLDLLLRDIRGKGSIPFNRMDHYARSIRGFSEARLLDLAASEENACAQSILYRAGWLEQRR